ncbi:zeaxanthin glucosyltransferase [Sphingomonas kaistensis]|uniref:Zeaxanthin glucosyltransferase n=1 Tax=Sphingomonas kaistensis TaxID=298708 RepID=A0A7X6BG44_9SPHN|nr:nucleotide disphospho-sugar-binding domain-containing protein [Sphingomonas kaistensis]NJC06069.1 zeaxanthin glucosyltransferase [Sphingomonas kaistensis]
MARIAFLCPPFAAHLASFRALGEVLRERGHEPFFLLNAGATGATGDIPIHHVPARPGDPAIGRVLAAAEKPGGLVATLRTIADSAALTDQYCEGGRERLAALGADAVVGDQMEPAGFLLAKALGLPFIGLACAVPIDPAPGVPLPFLDWPFEPSAEGKHRRTATIASALSRRQNQVIAGWAERFRIGPHGSLQDCLGPVQIAQIVPEFDLPRPRPLPFVPVGPLRRAEELADRPLPFARPDKPLVFATMGTLLGGDLKLWRALARACREAGTALVLAHGGRLSDTEAASLDVHHAADFLPYRSVMKGAALVITHGGSNTVLDALACGVPLLVRPVGFDQPGNLARVRHHGLGEELASLRRPGALAAQIKRLVADDPMHDRCGKVASALANAGGTAQAATIVESVLCP